MSSFVRIEFGMEVDFLPDFPLASNQSPIGLWLPLFVPREGTSLTVQTDDNIEKTGKESQKSMGLISCRRREAPR